jgi:hypothetical protein
MTTKDGQHVTLNQVLNLFQDERFQGFMECLYRVVAMDR